MPKNLTEVENLLFKPLMLFKKADIRLTQNLHGLVNME